MRTQMNNTDISPSQLARLLKLLSDANENLWYNTDPWVSRKNQVLKLDRYECQICKSKGKARRAVIVHHVKHLKDRPDLALSIWDPDTGKRQLISVCKRCHERLHPESFKKNLKKRPISAERWD